LYYYQLSITFAHHLEGNAAPVTSLSDYFPAARALTGGSAFPFFNIPLAKSLVI